MTYDEFITETKNKPLEASRVGDLGVERHHILPVCLGGTDEESNMIWLTPQEHYIAHMLLAQENFNNDKLIYAWTLMIRGGCDTPDKYAERAKRRNTAVSAEEANFKRNQARANSGKRQGRNSKPVAQYDSKGELMQIFSSVEEAAQYVGGAVTSIRDCIYGNKQSVYGYIWKYAE